MSSLISIVFMRYTQRWCNVCKWVYLLPAINIKSCRVAKKRHYNMIDRLETKLQNGCYIPVQTNNDVRIRNDWYNNNYIIRTRLRTLSLLCKTINLTYKRIINNIMVLTILLVGFSVIETDKRFCGDFASQLKLASLMNYSFFNNITFLNVCHNSQLTVYSYGGSRRTCVAQCITVIIVHYL